MSILSAIRQQSSSIDDLAKLPQAMIMQMAQKKQIATEMVAPILARKAEMIDAAAKSKAMQGGTPQTSVMEQIMAQNAMAEQPQQMPQQMPQMENTGVAQLPVPERMYAGGGIVAFQNNLNQPVSTNMPTTELSEEDKRYLEENPYLQRSRGVASLFKNVFDPNYVGEKVIGAARRFVSETPEEQAKRFRTASQARTGEIPMFAGTDLTTKGKMVAEGRMKPNESITDVMQKERKFANLTPNQLDEIARGQGVFPEGSPALPGGDSGVRVAKSGNVSTTKGESQVKTEPPKTKQDEKPPEEPLYSKYEKMLMDEREAAKGSREEAKYARLLEASLGMLGGESPYAFVNIGKGAAPALKGYGEDVKALRAEERGRIKELMGIESMRQEAKRAADELAIRKELAGYTGRQAAAAERQAGKPSSIAELAELYRTNPEIARQISGVGKTGAITFEEAYKLIAADPKNLTLNETQKAQKARELMTLGFGFTPQSGLPSGLPPGSTQVGTSQGKPVYKTPDGKLVTAS
jgi:hypothetical protein